MKKRYLRLAALTAGVLLASLFCVRSSRTKADQNTVPEHFSGTFPLLCSCIQFTNSPLAACKKLQTGTIIPGRF